MSGNFIIRFSQFTKKMCNRYEGSCEEIFGEKKKKKLVWTFCRNSPREDIRRFRIYSEIMVKYRVRSKLGQRLG